MSNREYNAIIFMSKYNPDSVLLLNNISELNITDGYIEFSVIVTIEQRDKLDRHLCLTLSKFSEDNKRIQGRLLKVFDLNDVIMGDEQSECIRAEKAIKPSIAKFSFRNTYKLNFPKLKVFGEGSYMLSLVECNAEELKNGALKIFKEKQISTVCFSVR